MQHAKIVHLEDCNVNPEPGEQRTVLITLGNVVLCELQVERGIENPTTIETVVRASVVTEVPLGRNSFAQAKIDADIEFEARFKRPEGEPSPSMSHTPGLWAFWREYPSACGNCGAPFEHHKREDNKVMCPV